MRNLFKSSEDRSAEAEVRARTETSATYMASAVATSAVAMMMVNRELVVTHVNEATQKLLRENTNAFRTIWPSFDPEKIVGSCIDMFHKNPGHQRQLLSDPSRLPYRTDISVGDMKFALNMGFLARSLNPKCPTNTGPTQMTSGGASNSDPL